MEGSGLLVSEWDMGSVDENGKPKRVFTITDKGRACLGNRAVALTDYCDYISGLVDSINKNL